MARLIVRTVNGVTTKYVYDEKDVLLELDDTNQNKARYTRTLDIDELISVERDTTNDGILDTTHYYHRDGLGSITAMTDSGGVVAASYVYDSFGSIKNQTGSVENRYTYTSREWDQEAGLYYYRARFYDSMQGRFISEDPKGFDGGSINFYTYVKNNPVNYIDPTGLYAKLCIEFALRGVGHVWLNVNGTKRGFYPKRGLPFDDGTVKDDSNKEGFCAELKTPSCNSCTQSRFESCLLKSMPLGDTQCRYNVVTRNCGSYLFRVISKCRKDCCTNC